MGFLKYLSWAISCCLEGGGSAGVAMAMRFRFHHQSIQQRCVTRLAHLFPSVETPFSWRLLLYSQSGVISDLLLWVESLRGWKITSFRCGCSLCNREENRLILKFKIKLSKAFLVEYFFRTNIQVQFRIAKCPFEPSARMSKYVLYHRAGFTALLLTKAVLKNVKS